MFLAFKRFEDRKNPTSLNLQERAIHHINLNQRRMRFNESEALAKGVLVMSQDSWNDVVHGCGCSYPNCLIRRLWRCNDDGLVSKKS